MGVRPRGKQGDGGVSGLGLLWAWLRTSVETRNVKYKFIAWWVTELGERKRVREWLQEGEARSKPKMARHRSMKCSFNNSWRLESEDDLLSC